MQRSILFLLLTTASLGLSANTGTFSCPEGEESIACQHKRAIEEVWVGMNQSSKELVDTLVKQPEKAIDMGCLDQLQQLDLDVFTVDPRSFYSTLVSAMNDKIVNRVCSAVEDAYNEQLARLEVQLEAPMGLGKVSLTNRGYIDGLDDLTETNVRLSNEEARREVIESTFGESPEPRSRRFSDDALRKIRVKDEGASDRDRRKKEQEQIEKRLDLNRLWSTKKEDDADG